jgi:hypothetical protein
MRYVLHPGYVESAHDSQAHFINGQELLRLYGVFGRQSTPIVFGDAPSYHEQPGDVHLRPRYDGDYSLLRATLRSATDSRPPAAP